MLNQLAVSMGSCNIDDFSKNQSDEVSFDSCAVRATDLDVVVSMFWRLINPTFEIFLKREVYLNFLKSISCALLHHDLSADLCVKLAEVELLTVAAVESISFHVFRDHLSRLILLISEPNMSSSVRLATELFNRLSYSSKSVFLKIENSEIFDEILEVDEIENEISLIEFSNVIPLLSTSLSSGARVHVFPRLLTALRGLKVDIDNARLEREGKHLISFKEVVNGDAVMNGSVMERRKGSTEKVIQSLSIYELINKYI